MYTGIFNLCRMSVTSGTKSSWLKFGKMARKFLDANEFPKHQKIWERHGHLGGKLFRTMMDNNILAATGNVYGNFQFVPDVSDIRHKIFLVEIRKNGPEVLGCKWVSKTPKNLGAAWTFRGLTFQNNEGHHHFCTGRQCTRKFSICAGCQWHPAQNLLGWNSETVSRKFLDANEFPKHQKIWERHGHLGG